MSDKFEAIIEALRKEANGNAFEKLFLEGDIAPYATTEDAERALCTMFASKTTKASEVDKLFQQSALYRPVLWKKYDYGKKLIRMVIAIALILYGLYMDSSMLTPMICLFIGCVMIANLNIGPRMLAKQVIKQMGNQFPHSHYVFNASEFKFHEEAEAVPYGKLIRLIEERQYFYLYVSEDSGYMVDKATITGSDVNGFKQFLTEKTGLKWERPASLLTFNLRSLLSKRKKKDTHPPTQK